MKLPADTKCIFHVDVNSAFLSWSAVKRLKEHPDEVDLRTIPSAVGGDIKTRHGVITAKSIPAKKYGIRTGEPVMRALEKCPDLVLVKSDFDIYRRYSRAFIGILGRYSDQVEQVSIDEAYMDMTENFSVFKKHRLRAYHPSDEEKESSDMASWAVSVAHRLKDEVRDTLGFTVNVGISVNKLLAKTASDFEKPDRVHTLWPSEVPEKMWPMPIGELHGCGPATASRLESIGINTVGDAAHTDLKILKSLLGEKAGIYIYESANGQGSDLVTGDRGDAKSYSNEMTLPEDVTQANFETMGIAVIQKLSDKVSERLKRDQIYGRVVTFTARTDDFKRHSRQMMLPESTNEADVIASTAVQLAYELLREDQKGLFARGRTVRLVGVGVSRLDKGEYRQMNLFDLAEQNRIRQSQKEREEQLAQKREDQERKRRERNEKLDGMVSRLNQKYGKDTVRRGMN